MMDAIEHPEKVIEMDPGSESLISFLIPVTSKDLQLQKQVLLLINVAANLL